MKYQRINNGSSPGAYLVILFLIGLFSIGFLPGASSAQTEKERVAKLVEGAKKEKNLMFYTSLTLDEGLTIAKRFTAKYPFIDTKVYRSGDTAMLTKIQGEARARRYVFDVVSSTGLSGTAMTREGLLAKYLSPQREFYPEGSKDPDGYWTDIYVHLYVIGYNTNMVSPREVPRSYQDLLDPKWKGKLGMDTKPYYWFANVMQMMGEEKGIEYFKKLFRQNIQFRTGTALNAQLVAAGETHVGVTVYNARIEILKAQGAPVEWVAIEPVVPQIHPLAISAHAPHPNAARLFIDFMLSKEGQELMASLYRIPPRVDVEPLVPRLKKGLNILPFDGRLADNYEGYIKLFHQLSSLR